MMADAQRLLLAGIVGAGEVSQVVHLPLPPGSSMTSIHDNSHLRICDISLKVARYASVLTSG